MIKKMDTYINNMKFRNKLMVIYFLCVFLPIVICNMIFYFNVRQNLIEDEMERTNRSLDRMGESLIQAIQEVVSVSELIYNDSNLNHDLDRKYLNFIEYSEEYNFNLKYSMSKFYPIYSQIKEITIYTANQTIITSGGYHPLGGEEIESNWYINLMKSSKNTLVFYNTELGTINLVRKLDNFKNVSQYPKYLLIEFRNEFIKNILSSEKLKGEIFLSNDLEEIVSKTVFLGRDKASQKGVFVMEKTFENSKFLKGWKIEGVFYDDTISEMNGAGDYIIQIMLISLLLATIFIVVISKSLSSRIQILSKHINYVGKNEFECINLLETKDEIGILINEFNRMVKIMKSLIRDVYESSISKQKLEIEMKQSQINALQSQINPHFLFNTFESIKMRCIIKGEDETAEIIQALSKNFRRMIAWDEDMVSVESEIEFIEAFLKIQQYRFKDKISYKILIDPACLQFLIPKMTIQPLVENAVEHGLAKKRGKGDICVSIEYNSNSLHCKVADNGIGMSKEKLQQVRDYLVNNNNNTNIGIGVKNVYQRLNLIYGSTTDFKIDSELYVGTVISFTVMERNHIN